MIKARSYTGPSTVVWHDSPNLWELDVLVVIGIVGYFYDMRVWVRVLMSVLFTPSWGPHGFAKRSGSPGAQARARLSEIFV